FWPTQSLRPVSVANGLIPPALLFQATDDAATPYRGAVTVHRLLARSALVVEQGGGNHGITLSGHACRDRHLAAYLADGTVPGGGGAGVADAVCEAPPDPEPPTSKAAAAPSRGSTLHGLLATRGRRRAGRSRPARARNVPAGPARARDAGQGAGGGLGEDGVGEGFGEDGFGTRVGQFTEALDARQGHA